MSGVNIGNVGLLYTKFEKVILDTFQDEAKAFNLPKKKTWRGDFIEGRVHVGRNAAMGFNEDGGAFPEADKQDYVPYRVGRRFWDAKLKLTDGAMAVAKESPEVAKDVIQSEVRGITKDALKYFNLMFYRDGTGGVSTLKNTGSTSGGDAVDVQFDDARLLWEGAKFEVWDSTGATYRGLATVSDIEQALNGSGYALVNFDGLLPSGSTAGDILYWRNSKGRAIAGLDSLIDDSPSSSFQGVDTTLYPRYTCMGLSNSGTLRPMTPALFRTLLAGMRQKCGNSKPAQGLKMFADSWQGVEFEELYEGELRMTTSDSKMGVGATTLVTSLGNVSLETDVDCKRNTIFAVDVGELCHAIQKEMGFRLQGGQMFQRSDQAAHHTATMYYIGQMYIENRYTSGRIDDLEDGATIAY